MRQVTTMKGPQQLDRLPNNCPFCHKSITPEPLYGFCNNNAIEVFFVCPNETCQKTFIGYYFGYGSKTPFTGETSIGNLQEKDFSDTIKSISPDFIVIYNQAFVAEQQDLIEICGVGFRKALEFLIKDYLIVQKPDEKEKVEKKLLGKCIQEYVDDHRIKSVAMRAAWLGNDETHYIRKWEGKSLDDLKKLIDLTVHWIEMESLTSSFVDEMPD